VGIATLENRAEKPKRITSTDASTLTSNASLDGRLDAGSKAAVPTPDRPPIEPTRSRPRRSPARRRPFIPTKSASQNESQLGLRMVDREHAKSLAS
jgi:hypothetical protein